MSRSEREEAEALLETIQEREGSELTAEQIGWLEGVAEMALIRLLPYLSEKKG